MRLLFLWFSVAALLSGCEANAAQNPLAALHASPECRAWLRYGSSESTGSAVIDGLRSPFFQRVDLRTGRYVRRWRSLRGAIPGGEGFNGARWWVQDRSGASHDLDAPDARALVVTLAWLNRRGWCGSLGTVTISSATTAGGTDEVTARPKGGAPVTMWIDTAAKRVVRTRVRQPEDHEVDAYSDWRTVSGVAVPFLRTVVYPEDQEREIWRISNVKLSARMLPAMTFASPAPPDDVALHGRSTSVPLAIKRDKPLIAVRLDGRGPFTYVLDSGGHFIATPTTASAVGLQQIGVAAETGQGNGILTTRFAKVASVSIGGAVMRNQIAKIVPYSRERLQAEGLPDATGWLGLETFERFAVTFDPRGRLTLEPFRFARVPQGIRVPIVFDEDAPLAMCRIQGQPGLCMIDTGNGGSTIIEGHWAQDNGLAAQFLRGRRVGDGFYSSRVHIIMGSLDLGSVQIVYSVPAERGSESTTTVAAILSESVLRRYVMTLNYAQGAAWFKRIGCLTPSVARVRACPEGAAGP